MMAATYSQIKIMIINIHIYICRERKNIKQCGQMLTISQFSVDLSRSSLYSFCNFSICLNIENILFIIESETVRCRDMASLLPSSPLYSSPSPQHYADCNSTNYNK